ncbi:MULTISPECIES: CHAP domain-containing protein [unclassified Streptomyces]|uniref:C40 family peptidase n=1 Tax=unclassified Streptomyces TaxID=2593676 RepID=UPI000379E2F4|nr:MULTISPECIES: CHAP domain-containing protein [unclassified Streptomyces]MYT31760.1 CHAP domain-containing protein [Streptomyces sp. SID8354]
MGDAQKIINTAKAEVGYHEGRSNGHWNNWQKYSPAVPGLEWSQNQAWCATFISWCAMKAGLAGLYPRTASCATGVAWFKARNRFSEYPAVGAQVFFGPGGGSHTGLVYAFDGDFVYTVEGNTNGDGSAEGDGVYLKKRQRRSSYVYGYGYPAFAEGVDSAAPAWKDKKPTAAKPSTAIVSLASGVKPGVRHPQVRELQRLLIAAGYGPIRGAVTDYYGANTQAAVNRFHLKNPQYMSRGTTYDPAIGNAGFIGLQKQAGRR